MSTPAQPRRKTLSFEEKIALINAVSNRKGKKKDVAARFGVRPSTLSTILKAKDRIFTAVSSGTSGARKKLRTSTYEDVDKAVLRWILDMRTRNVPLNGPMLQEKARDIALRLGCDDFKASPGWLTRFKGRHASLAGLKRGEWLPPPELNGVPLQDAEDVREALAQYRARDVYAAQEMALFYRMLPHEARAFKEDPCVGGSRSGQRLTVFLCTNMDGSDKRLPLVIGKSERPRCFRGTKCVPVKYVAHPKAWMTPLIFCNWLCDFNASMAEQGRSVCLMVSRCKAHIIGDLALSNVRLCYVDAESLSPLPCPLNLGVTNSLRCAYRQGLLERVLVNFRLGKDIQVDLFQALQVLVEAWRSVKPSTIATCFQMAGIDVKMDFTLPAKQGEVFNSAVPPAALSKSWHLLRMCGMVPENTSLSDFLYSDSWAVSTEEENAEVILGSVEDDYPYSDERENCEQVPFAVPAAKDVLDAIDVLRVYAGSYEDLDAAFEAIDLYESCIRTVLWRKMQAAMKLEQGSIVSGVELLAEAALTATERLDTEVVMLQDAAMPAKAEEEVAAPLAQQPVEPTEVRVKEEPEPYIAADEEPQPMEPTMEPVEIAEPHSEPGIVVHSDPEQMDVEVEGLVAAPPPVLPPAMPTQPPREASHSSVESGPVAAPPMPIQPAEITYSDDSQSKSLPGLTGIATHHQPTGFDSSMFKMGTPLPEVAQPPALHAAVSAPPLPAYPPVAPPTMTFPLVVTPSTSLGGVSSATGETDDVNVGGGSSKVHKDKKKKKKKDKKHKHKHKHRSHDRLLEKERFYSSGGSTNQSPAPFGGGGGGGASSSPQHEII